MANEVTREEILKVSEALMNAIRSAQDLYNRLNAKNDTSTVKTSSSDDQSEKSKMTEKDLMIKVTKILHDLAVPANIKGYNYLRTAIILVVKDNSLIHYVTKGLYPAVAKEHKTTSSRVERAIRHAIECCCMRGNYEYMTEIFGYSINMNSGKIVNSEFIARIVDNILLEM